MVNAIRAQLAHGPYTPSTLYGDGHVAARLADALARLTPYVQKRLHYIVDEAEQGVGQTAGELALAYAPGPVGADETRRAAELVTRTTDVLELRRLGGFDDHGDPLDPPVRFEPYDG